MKDEKSKGVSNAIRSKGFWSIFTKFSHDIMLLVALVGSMIVFELVTGRFLNSRNINVILTQCAEIGLMGLGMGLTIMMGGIDLSVNDSANLSALVGALFLINFRQSFGSEIAFVVLAILISVGVGTLCGILNGLMIAYLRVTPILATLGTLTLFRGISAAVTGGKRIAGFPRSITAVGRGSTFGVPNPFWIFVISAVVLYIVVYHTSLGYKMRLVGTNAIAARFSALKDRFAIFLAYVISGILASLAGIIIMGRTGSVAYEYGTQTYILLARAIGSLAAVEPGFASIPSLVLSTIVLQVLSSGFYTMMMTSSRAAFFKDMFWGVFLIGVLVFERVLRSIRKPRLALGGR
ncbi:ABC transporter permease [Thermotoga caldifontis]|uniref:ABC transporter permease n=1 Tax=Thermotoga caldifontis TaxID=1508419 RepID=UPI0005978E94|nr:ABC transporter permease [Thermotoga caldifontis]